MRVLWVHLGVSAESSGSFGFVGLIHASSVASIWVRRVHSVTPWGSLGIFGLALEFVGFFPARHSVRAGVLSLF